jgi:hypothetical protein
MKTLFLPFLLLPMILLAEQQPPRYAHQGTADSIIAYFLSEEIFQRYVKIDTRESKSIKPNAHFFQYNFRHPKFSGETFIIAFTLDSAGHFVPGDETRGLIRIPSTSDSAWITRRQALDISSGREHRVKKSSLRLDWDPTNVSYQTFQKTNDFRDIVAGDIVWKVDGKVLFRGDRYSGTFEVNVLTGSLARRFAIPWD